MIILPNKSVSPLSRLSRHLASSAFDGAKFFIFVDENSYEHCLPQVIFSVPPLQQAEFVELPVGDECKDMSIATQVLESLLESGADRTSVIVNLGGGAVCDFGGFVASVYMRGIRHINIPTTLTAMVDAAIGGKTALDLGGVKNVIGTFRMAETVCVDPVFLSTLPDEEMRAGVGELVKTLMLSTSDIGEMQRYLQTPWNDLVTSENIVRAAQFKSSVVKADKYDVSVRHILNLGHTFGHAIEAYSHVGASPIQHGVAVALGVGCALYLSKTKKDLSAIIDTCSIGMLYDSYTTWLKLFVQTPKYTLADTEKLLQYVRADKKNSHGAILCVLLKAPGEAVIDVEVSENELRDAFMSL